MAKLGVTGRTAEGVEERREEWNDLHPDEPFENHFCLAKIPNQPVDYEGPQRYCMQTSVNKIGDNYICKHHGGAGRTNTEKIKDENEFKHGLCATQQNLIDDFDENDWALYDWVIDSHTKYYDLRPASDPGTAYDLHRLAVEMVRAERGRSYAIENGEVEENPVKDENGQIVIENGKVVTEKSENALTGMLRTQDNKITKLKKELGITRKERERSEEKDVASEIIKDFTELGSSFVDPEDHEFEPNSEKWN